MEMFEMSGLFVRQRRKKMKPIKSFGIHEGDWLSTYKYYNTLNKDDKLVYIQVIGKVLGVGYNIPQDIQIKCWEILDGEIIKEDVDFPAGEEGTFLLDENEIREFKKRLILKGLE